MQILLYFIIVLLYNNVTNTNERKYVTVSIKSDLRKEGIQVIKQLNTLKVNSIATHIAKKLVDNFPEQNFNYHELFTRISRLNMYIAKIPNGIAAKYFYKNASIYFSESTNLENINDDVVIHECIHSLQSNINSNNKLVKLRSLRFYRY